MTQPLNLPGSGRSRRIPLVLLGSTALAVASVAAATETSTYTYDALGRLTGVARSGGPNTGAQINTSFDANGNRLSHGVAGGAGAMAAPADPLLVQEPSLAPAVESAPAPSDEPALIPAEEPAPAPAEEPAPAPAEEPAPAPVQEPAPAPAEEPAPLPAEDPAPTSPEQPAAATAEEPVVISAQEPAAPEPVSSSGPANQPPVANSDSASVPSCASASIDVVANDTDPENNVPLVLVSVGSGSRGSASVESSTSIFYSAPTTAGSDEFTYTVQDALGATSTGTVSVTIIEGQCK